MSDNEASHEAVPFNKCIFIGGTAKYIFAAFLRNKEIYQNKNKKKQKFPRTFHSVWFFGDAFFFLLNPTIIIHFVLKEAHIIMSLIIEIAPIINSAPPANTCRMLPLKELCKVRCG